MDSRMHSAPYWRQFAASIQCDCVSTVYRYWAFAQPCTPSARVSWYIGWHSLDFIVDVLLVIFCKWNSNYMFKAGFPVTAEYIRARYGDFGLSEV